MKGRTLNHSYYGLLRRLVSLIVVMAVLLGTTIVLSNANVFYTIRINYLFVDGRPATDAYVGTYPKDANVDITVTNPNINGFVPMTLTDPENDPADLINGIGGIAADTTEFHINPLDQNYTETVYYVPGLTHYRALYYKQNLYDDLYTRDNTLPASLTDRYGKTGSNPTDLEDIQFPGFTNLFHEPDAIAADGSTVFRVYYDRNYYKVMFDLGSHGYGTEPVYAKYESVYHVTEPKRLGYTFKGWLRTDKDSSQGVYAHSGAKANRSADTAWRFVDENGDELVDGSGNPLFDEHGDPVNANSGAEQYYIPFFETGTIPAQDTYFKAAWDRGTTGYSVVYWIQNPDGEDITAEQLNATSSIEEARTLISTNYSVAAAKDIKNVPSGTMINLDTTIRCVDGQDVPLWDLFACNLGAQATDTVGDEIIPREDSSGYPLDKNNRRVDFFGISEAKSAELVGKSKFYEFNEEMSLLQFSGAHETDQHKTHLEVAGDGTTRINVYYNRKDFTLKFYYVRQKLVNGQPTGRVELTNSTKVFSEYNYYGNNESHLVALSKGTWEAGKNGNGAADTRPKIAEKYRGILTPTAADEDGLYEDYNGYRYWYYEIFAQYNEPLANKWLIDAITPVHKQGFAEEEICYPGSWATEYKTKYQDQNTTANGGKRNYTIKGIYDSLGDELMFINRTQDYTTLHFLLSWTNSSSTNNKWNYSVKTVLHFRYEGYTELLPNEIELAQHAENGYQALVDNGTYLDVITRTFTDLQGNSVTRSYGLPEGNRVETTDSGDQYPYKSNPAQRSANNQAVYDNQTAAEIRGFKLENFEKNQTTGKVKLNANNTEIDWSEDTENDRHATIKFFYQRNHYVLKWRNGNRLVEDKTRDVMYGAPLNSVYTHDEGDFHAGDYRYWFDDPIYFNEDLRDYYNFMGWYYTPYYYRLVNKDTATMPADDMTLYARWDPKIINVSFYPTYNDYYVGQNRIGDPIPVNYGDYVPINSIPADTNNDPESLRPELEEPTSGAMFAGWYYLRDNIPYRIDPENVPITALNRESSVHNNARLRLYAEWATKDAAKYQVKYVEKDNHDNEVAPQTVGRSFVWKTKTFNAKGGSDLNAEHAFDEDSINWWPTEQSHSMVIRSNTVGKEYDPNTYTFEYIQKQGVYYQVQYLDAKSRTPLLDPAERGKDEVYSIQSSVKEDAPFIPGYVAETMSQTKVLTASTASDAAEQKAQELETNIIVFYYNKNESDYVYEAEYYEQDINDNDYTLYLTENLEISIADDPETDAVEPTYLALSDLYATRVPTDIESGGFTRVAGATMVSTTDGAGNVTTTSVADNASVQITGDTKTTIKIYFNRNLYDYRYEYIDYSAEQKYNKMVEAGQDVTGKWNGLMATFNSTEPAKYDSVVTIPAPHEYSHTGLDFDRNPVTDVPYVRLEDKAVELTIAPTNPDNPDVNLVRVYYRKFSERELRYKLVCRNENESYAEVDYDATTGDPLYGGLSITLQTVDDYSKISNVLFYNFNNAQISDGHGGYVDVHQHKYEFIGWFDNPRGTGTPLAVDGEGNPSSILTKADLGLEEGELPGTDMTYYAVVEQVMVRAAFDFRIVDGDLPIGEDTYTGEGEIDEGAENEQDRQAAAIVRGAMADPDGSYTGCTFVFDDPYLYENGTPLPYNKTVGYTLSIQPKPNDPNVYKYEFTEWWEEDLDNIDQQGNTKLIRKKNWNVTNGPWAPTQLEEQLDRTEDKHVMAVFKRRDLSSIKYVTNYVFTDRSGNRQTYVKIGTLSGTQLDEESANCALDKSLNYYALSDEFIMRNAPYESNHDQVIRWTDAEGSIVKESFKKDWEKGDDGSTYSENTIVTTVYAEQEEKTVHAHYRTIPGGAYTTITGHIGDNYTTNEAMQDILAPETDVNGCYFSHWEVRKSEHGEVIARCYDVQFELCLMSDNYYIDPVYEDNAPGTGTMTATLVPGPIADDTAVWSAWTWDTNALGGGVSNGERVFPAYGLTFRGLKERVIFVKSPEGTTNLGNWLNNLSITSVTCRSHELDVEDGKAFVVTGTETLNPRRMEGDWQDYEESAPEPEVTLTHLDYSRNQWTDEEGVVNNNGRTDIIYTDFEIALDKIGEWIVGSANKDLYEVGMVFELCAQLPESARFDPARDYNQVSDPTNLKAAVAAKATSYVYNPSKPNKTRSIQVCPVLNTELTNRNRVQFGKGYYNVYNESTGRYTNSTYLMKATAYLVQIDPDDASGKTVTLSNSIYICLNDEARKDLAVGNMGTSPVIDD